MKRFRLEVIGAFDARRGYTRCDPPGTGVIFVGGPSAVADFWMDRNGDLAVRCSCREYRLNFTATLADGRPVPASAMNDFADFVAEVVLHDWIIEGVDDDPDCVYEE